MEYQRCILQGICNRYLRDIPKRVSLFWNRNSLNRTNRNRILIQGFTNLRSEKIFPFIFFQKFCFWPRSKKRRLNNIIATIERDVTNTLFLKC